MGLGGRSGGFEAAEAEDSIVAVVVVDVDVDDSGKSSMATEAAASISIVCARASSCEDRANNCESLGSDKMEYLAECRRRISATLMSTLLCVRVELICVVIFVGVGVIVGDEKVLLCRSLLVTFELEQELTSQKSLLLPFTSNKKLHNFRILFTLATFDIFFRM